MGCHAALIECNITHRKADDTMMILRRTIVPGYLALPGYLTLLCPLLTGACLSQSATATLKFDFSGGPGKPGYTRVSPALVYTDEIGYGYQPRAQGPLG